MVRPDRVIYDTIPIVVALAALVATNILLRTSFPEISEIVVAGTLSFVIISSFQGWE